MSTYWNLRCADCHAEPDMDTINHGEEALREMVALGRALLAVPAESSMEYDLRVWGRNAPMSFLRNHRDHRLVIQSEYGEEEPVEWPEGEQP